MQPIFNAIIQNDIPAFLGNTPLHLAALLGDVNTIRTLLEFGSETCSARNSNYQTPLHLVCRSIPQRRPYYLWTRNILSASMNSNLPYQVDPLSSFLRWPVTLPLFLILFF
uniref:Uncharacterized protein n=1 Tax=Brassica oleracea TaxID=3712 RepID=A0A3P6CEU0_BRAOL|nr:unnamed protein product [Brassica oleracea]